MHLVSVSVLLFGSCHLILFVNSTNSIQIVRRQCCLAQASKMHQTQNQDLLSCCKTPSTKNPATRSANHLSCWDLEQSQAKILCRDLKQQIYFCVANQNALRLVKASPSARVLTALVVHKLQTVVKQRKWHLGGAQVNRMQNAKWPQAGGIGCKICISDADGASGARQEILISRYAAWSLYSKWNDAVDLSQTPKVVFSEA